MNRSPRVKTTPPGRVALPVSPSRSIENRSLAARAETNHAPPAKIFKACQPCRKQKMRCEGREEDPDKRCRRCIAAHRDCVLDPTTPSSRQVTGDRNGNAKRRRIESLEAELRQLHGDDTLSPAATRPTSSRPGQVSEMVGVSLLIEPELARSCTTTPVPRVDERLSPGSTTIIASRDLAISVLAFNEMAPTNDLAQSTVWKVGTLSSNLNGGLNINTKSKRKSRIFKEQDLVSKGVLDEFQARNLFSLFMAAVSNSLPIFDPVSDTFDLLRVQEPFCFSVIIALACRVRESESISESTRIMCQTEAMRLAAKSLFENPTTLASVQAMFLLAAYAEDSWFAIGHALQMALDIGLDKAPSRLLGSAGHLSSCISIKERRLLMSHTRVWFALCFLEREIATGTARCSRLPQLGPSDLRVFHCQPMSRSSDMRLASLTESIQLREQYRQQVQNADNLHDTAIHWIETMKAKFHSWWEYWDRLHEDYGYDAISFERSSLQIQKNYEVIFMCCSILGRLQKEAEGQYLTLQSLDNPTTEMLKYTASSIMEQLTLVLSSMAYKSSLRWATTYTVLSVAFSTVFALKISMLRPDLINRDAALSTAADIADVLKKYPYPNFYCLIRLLIDLTLDATFLSQTNQQSDIEEASRESYQFRDIWCPRNSTNINAHEPQISSDAQRVQTTQSERSPRLSAQKFQAAETDNLLQDILNGNIQAPSWMLEPALILSLGIPEQGSCSLFDFDMP